MRILLFAVIGIVNFVWLAIGGISVIAPIILFAIILLLMVRTKSNSKGE